MQIGVYVPAWERNGLKEEEEEQDSETNHEPSKSHRFIHFILDPCRLFSSTKNMDILVIEHKKNESRVGFVTHCSEA